MAPRKTKSVVEDVAGTIKPPITFKEFSKDPVKGLLFIVLIAIGYLYVDIRTTFSNQADKQETRTERLEVRVDSLQKQVVNLASESSAKNAKLEVLQSLKKIPQ